MSNPRALKEHNCLSSLLKSSETTSSSDILLMKGMVTSKDMDPLKKSCEERGGFDYYVLHIDNLMTIESSLLISMELNQA